MGNNVPEERHKRAVAASRLEAGNTLAGMAMDGIVLTPPPSVVKVKIKKKIKKRQTAVRGKLVTD